MKRYGLCSCARKVPMQRAQHDSKIWRCVACTDGVCDDCYHLHFAAKHIPEDAAAAFALGAVDNVLDPTR